MRVEGDAGGRIDVATRFSPATFDSLDIFGRGVVFASVSAEDSLLRVDGQALFDVDSDLYLFTLGTGVIDVGGLLSVTATGSIIADRSPDEVVAASTIAAGTFRAEAGDDYRGDGSTIDSAGLIDIDTPGRVEAGTLTAGGRIEIDGDGIALTAGTAAGAIDLAAPGAIDVGTADAGTGFVAVAGADFTADDVVADAGIAIDAASIVLTAATAGGDIDLDAPGAINVGTADAGADFVAAAGADFTAADVDADAGIAIDAASITLTAATSGGDTDLASPGAIDVGTADAGADFLAVGSGFTADDIDADADIAIDAASIVLTAATAAGAIDLASPGAINVGTADAGAEFIAVAGGAFAADDVTAGGVITIDGTSIALTAATSGGDIDLDSPGSITVGTVDAGADFVAVAGAGFTANDDVTADGGIMIDGASIVLTAATAGGAIDLASPGALNVGTADAGADFVATAGAGFTADDVDAGAGIAIDANTIQLTAAMAGGEIDLDAPGAISVGTADAGADFVAAAGAGFTADRIDADAGIAIDGGSITLTAAAAGGDIDLASSGDIDVGTAAAGDDFLAAAGGRFTGADITANVGSDILIDAVGLLQLDNGEASGLIRLTSTGDGVVSDGRLQAGNTLAVDAATDIDLAEAEAGTIDLAAGDDVAVAGMDAGGSVLATSGGDIAATDVQAGQNVDFDAGGNASVGNATAGRDLLLSGVNVSLTDGVAGRDIRLDAGAAVAVTRARAGDDFRAVAGTTFTGGDVDATGLGPDSEPGTGPLNGAGNILIEANGALRLDNGDAAGRLRLDSFGAGITSDGALAAARLEATAAADLALTDATASGAIILTSQNGGIAGAGFDSGGGLRLDAAGAVTVADAQAGTNLVADAASVDFGNAVAGRDVTLTADAGITLGTAEAGDDFSATAGAGFGADSVVATGLAADSENGVGALAGSGNVSVTAAGDLRLDDGTAAAAVALSSDGNLLSDGLISAGTTLTAGARLDLDLDDARAGSVLNLAADGAVDAGDLSGGDLIFAGSRGSVTIASADADGPISIEAEGDVTAGNLSAGGFIGVDAGGAADIGAADAARFIAVTASGPADLGVLNAARDIDVDASGITVASATAGRDVTLDSGAAIAAGQVAAGDDFRATAGGAIAAGTAITTGLGADNEGDGSRIAIEAAGDLRLDNAAAPGRIGLVSNGGDILSDGTLAAARLDAETASDLRLNDVIVTDDLALAAASGAISGNSFTSQAGIDLDASGAVALAAVDAGDGLVVDGASIDLASAAAGGDIALTSAGALIVGPAAAGGAFIAQAGGDGSFAGIGAGSVTVDLAGAAAFNGAVLADTISVGSADIDIGAAGSLGGPDAQLVLLRPLDGGPQTVLGGSIDGLGFTLSEAEAGRIAAAVLRIQAPPAAGGGADLLVRDVTLDAGRVGRLELLVAGVARVEGGLRLTGAGADHAIAIAADDRLEIVAPAGGIRLLDGGGMPAGTLTVRANSIWSASALLIDRLAADPDFAGRDVLLRTNGGPFAPRGQVEADGIALFVRDSLFVQNSGRPTDLAGLTVGAGGLTLTPTGAAPLNVYAFGRRIDPAGGFVTNTAFFGEVRYEPGTAGYSEPAQFNLCFINTGICNAPDAPLSDGSDPIRGPFDVPGPAEFRDELIDASFAAEPLIDEPVTSGSDTIEWACETDEEQDCPREPRDD